MVIVAALFVAGIIIGRYLVIPPSVIWIAGCSLFIVTLLTLLAIFLPVRYALRNAWPKDRTIQPAGATTTCVAAPNSPGQYRRWLWRFVWSLLALAIVVTGIARWQINQNLLTRNNIARAAPAHGRRFITARLLITSAPEFHPSPPRGILFSATGPSTTFFGRMSASRVNGRWVPATGNVVARVPGYLPGLKNNQTVQLTGWLSRPPGASNPGGFDYRQYLTAFRVFAELSATQAEQIRVISDKQTLLPMGGWLDAWRAHLRRRLLADHPHNQRTNGYALIALLLGYRDPSIRPLARAFSRAGAAHLLALSGMHVVIIAAAIWLVLKFFIHRPRYRALATLILVFIYMLMTPCGPPVVRAAIGTGLVLLSWMLGRPVRALNILALTALIVTLWRPAEIFQPPFQLSFIVTLGLILLAHRVHLVLFHPWLTRQGEIARAVGTRWAAFKVNAMAWIAAITTANLVGSFVALPLVAYHYNQFNPLAILNGLILLPLVAAALIAGLIEMAAGFGSSALSHLAAMIAGPIAHLLAGTVTYLAALPGSEIIVRSPPMIFILIFFAILLAWMFRINFRLRRAIIAGAFTFWALSLGSWYALSGASRGAQIWVLDAGSGDAVVLHARRNILLDAGSLGSAARLAEVIDGALRHLGLWHLDEVLVTQIDSAHCAAVPNIAARHGGLRGWADAMDINNPTATDTRFLNAAGAAGLTLHPAVHDQRIALGTHTQLTTLWPMQPSATARKLRGLILLLQHGNQKVLFIARTQAMRSVLTHLNSVHHLNGVVLLGSGVVHPPLVQWLEKVHPHWIVATGETHAAHITDQQLLAPTGIRLFQTRPLGAVNISLHHGKSIIQSMLHRRRCGN